MKSYYIVKHIHDAPVNADLDLGTHLRAGTSEVNIRTLECLAEVGLGEMGGR